MSMLEEMKQMYLTIQALSVVVLESHGGVSEATQNLEHQIAVLEEMFKPFEVNAEMVKHLREITGEGMMACKKALIHTRGNVHEAVLWLR